MSCYHRYGHGCDWPLPPPDWYDSYACRPHRYRDELVVVRDDEDEYYDEARPRRRRNSGRARPRRDETASMDEVTAASLQSRARSLREELNRIEQDLAELSTETGPSAQTSIRSDQRRSKTLGASPGVFAVGATSVPAGGRRRPHGKAARNWPRPPSGCYRDRAAAAARPPNPGRQ